MKSMITQLEELKRFAPHGMINIDQAIAIVSAGRDELIKQLMNDSIVVICPECGETNSVSGELDKDDHWSHCMSFGCGCSGWVTAPLIIIDEIIGRGKE